MRILQVSEIVSLVTTAYSVIRSVVSFTPPKNCNWAQRRSQN